VVDHRRSTGGHTQSHLTPESKQPRNRATSQWFGPDWAHAGTSEKRKWSAGPERVRKAKIGREEGVLLLR
jgi:hypothetical protein